MNKISPRISFFTNHETVSNRMGRPGYWESRAKQAEAKRDKLRDALVAAPHADNCASASSSDTTDCDCYKAVLYK